MVVVGGLTLLLLISLAITIPVELHNRSHSGVPNIPTSDGKVLRYYVVGDYGELDRKKFQKNTTELPVDTVAEEMAGLAAEYPVDFIATTGDNVYPDGMEDVFDWRQFELMYQVFDRPGLSGKPWYPVYGNHDCKNPKTELDASEVYPMWNMHQPYYNLTLRLDNNATAVLIFLDGCTISCEQVGNDPLPGFCDEYKYTQIAIEEQYKWLNSVLEGAQSADWILVHTHMPPFSAGSGSGDTEVLKLHLLPILQNSHVDVLFTGHEHIMEYFYIPNNQPYIPGPSTYHCENTTSYLKYSPETYLNLNKGSGLQEVVIGSSGHPLVELCPDRVTSMAELVFGSATFGYVQVDVRSTEVNIGYYNETGNALFKVTIIA